MLGKFGRNGIVFILLLAGCNYYNQKTPTILSADTTSFVWISENILGPKCLRCHSGSDSHGVDLTTYQNVMQNQIVVPKNLAASRLHNSIVEGAPDRMPKGGPYLTKDEMSIIAGWIMKGAPETSVSAPAEPPPPSPEPTPTYAYIRKYIFEVRCVGCHDGKNPKTELDLRTYDSLMAADRVVRPENSDRSRLYTRLISDTEPMPPKPPRLEQKQIDAVAKWIDDGANPE